MANVLNRETLMPVGFVIAIVVGCVSIAVTLNNYKAEQSGQLKEISGQLETLKEDMVTQVAGVKQFVRDTTVDMYTKSEAGENASRTALLNDDMLVVDPRDPDKVMPNSAGKAYMGRRP